MRGVGPGTEFFAFPHEQTDLEPLQESGWIDWQTLAIIHE